MKKLLVYLEEDSHEDLKELAHRKKTTMSELIRYALDKTFKDELDAISLDRSLEEAAENPSSTMSWEEYKAQRAERVRTSA